MSILQRISTTLHTQMTQWRQDIHAHPETAYEEHRTAALVAQALSEMGMQVHTGIGKTGVVGVLKKGQGKSIGLRADMDALNMTEKTGLPYSSTYDGKMHACGHDGHTAMLLGAAQYLSQNADFQGTVNFIFQPAEEGAGGALAMVKDGLFDRFPCDAVFGMHNAPRNPLGHFALRPGPMLAASDLFEIHIKGVGTHAAHPHMGHDAITTAAQLITGIQHIVSRNINPLDTLIISVTQIQAGETWNVLPDIARLRGTCRSLEPAVRALARERLQALCDGLALSTRTHIELDYQEGYPAAINAPEPTQLAIAAAQQLVGAQQVDPNCPPRTGSEDFSFMQQQCPGAYIILGTAKGTEDPPVHSPYYDFNDAALIYGAAYWVTLTENFLAA